MKPEIDLHLSVLVAVTPRHHTMTSKDIADFCGCSTALIQGNEIKAKDKLRRKPIMMQNFEDLEG